MRIANQPDFTPITHSRCEGHGFDPPRLHHPTRQTIKPPVPPPDLARDHGAPGRRIRRGGLPERPPRRASQRRRSVNSNKKTATINCLHDCMLLHLQQISSILSLDSCAHLQQKLDLNCVLARVGRWLSEPSQSGSVQCQRGKFKIVIKPARGVTCSRLPGQPGAGSAARPAGSAERCPCFRG